MMMLHHYHLPATSTQLGVHKQHRVELICQVRHMNPPQRVTAGNKPEHHVEPDLLLILLLT